MPIYKRRPVPFQSPQPLQETAVFDYTQGLNTRDPDSQTNITKGQNVRFGRDSGFDTRPGSIQKGSQIGIGSKILGLHSYIKKSGTAQLLAAYNTDLYQFSESGTPTVITTSTSSQATGYGKDRHIFFTTAVDANSKPYLVMTYQSGTGISLRSSSSPYTSWSSATVIDSSTQIGWSCFIDTSDNLHVAYMDTANSVKYVKLTFTAGPSWTVGTKQSVAGTGAGDSATNPTIAVDANSTIHVAYRYQNGVTNVNTVRYSINSGASWSGAIGLGTSSTFSTYAIAATVIGGIAYFVIQQDTSGAGTAYQYFLFLYNNSYSYTGQLGAGGGTTSTLNVFSVVPSGTTVALYTTTSASSNGLSMTAYGLNSGSQRRVYDTVNIGVSNNDIQYRNIVAGAEDIASTRVAITALNNLYPSVVPLVPSGFSYIPVMWTEGTGSPYNIRINTFNQWTALSAGLTAGNNSEGAYFYYTDSHYITNGVDSVKKWDGTTLTSATATGYPTAKYILSYDSRLWLFNVAGSENTAYYTPQFADNFTGTFPLANNYLAFEGAITGAVIYRDRQLLIFTATGIYFIQNYDYSGATVGADQVRKIPNSHGTLSHRTIKQVGYWIYFQSPDGQIRRTNGLYVEEPAVSDIIRPTIAGLGLSQLTSAAAGVINEFYFLALSSATAGQNDTVIVLDTVRAGQGGFSIDTGKYCSCFVSHAGPNKLPQLFYGDARTAVGSVYQSETGTNDNGVAIDMIVDTGTKFPSSTFYRSRLRDILPLATASGNYSMIIGVAKSLNKTSFTLYTVSLSPNTVVWGTGKWGDGRKWGGQSDVEPKIRVNQIERGFKFRFRTSGLDQPISVQGFTFTYELMHDNL